MKMLISLESNSNYIDSNLVAELVTCFSSYSCFLMVLARIERVSLLL
jgi:hypothetical protein